MLIWKWGEDFRVKTTANFYKALGDETRLKILEMLVEQELCVCEIIDRLNMSQPAVSHHLKILRQAGLVKDSKEGKWIYYSLNEDVFEQVFGDRDFSIVQVYAQPIKDRLSQSAPSRIRTEPSYCEKLNKKKK